ncbi:MAG: sugar transferase [Patescibacteria group bacterium]|jgi:exopolysaccharide biosynthesis polyprenyl glycosylphosphotransferase
MKRSEIIISAGLVPIDYLMVVLAGIAGYYFRFWEPISAYRPVVFNLPFPYFLSWLWLMAVIWIVTFALAGLYNMRGTSRAVDEVSKIILASTAAVAILMFFFFFSRSLFDSRFIILAAWIFSIVCVMFGRGLMRFLQRRLYGWGVGIHRVIIIGVGNAADEVVREFTANPRAGYRVVDQFKNFDAATEKELSELKLTDKFDEILVARADLSTEISEKLHDFSYVNHVELKYIADIFDFPINNFVIDNIAGLPVVELKKTKLDGWGRIGKRLFDMVGSILLVVILSPVLLIIILAVKLSSAGPLFFTYQRIGEYGKPFVYFKFRTMIKDAHKFRFDEEFIKSQENVRAGTPMMKFKNDPRITPVGKFLRRYSLDELPELFIVFLGKMSLVGPRPHEVEEVAKYETFHKRVLSIKPGITGMAQVSGRSDLDFDEEVRLDVWYMENWSMKLDLMVLFKTPFAIVRKRQAE